MQVTWQVTGSGTQAIDAEGPGAIAIAVAAPDAVRLAGPRAQATETRRLYASDWRGFLSWCRGHQQAALPAEPATVAAYLADQAGRTKPLALGALSRCAAAIADQHRRTGHPSPTTDATVRALLRAARQNANARATTARAVRAATAFPRAGRPTHAAQAAQQAAAARCPGDLAGLRDRALLLLAAAGIGGDTLLQLDREHVDLGSQQLVLHPPGLPAKAGMIVIPRAANAATCAMRALDTWLRVSDTQFGPVFRKVDRWGGVAHQRLRADGLRRIWQRRLAARRGRTPIAAAA